MSWRLGVGALLVLGGVAGYFNGADAGYRLISDITMVVIGLALIIWDQRRRTPRPPR